MENKKIYYCNYFGNTIVPSINSQLTEYDTLVIDEGFQQLNTACDYTDWIKCVYLPSSLNSIGDFAFSMDSNLEEVHMENCKNLETIGKGIFENTKIKYLILPDCKISLSEIALYNMNYLEYIVVSPNTLKYYKEHINLLNDKTKIISVSQVIKNNKIVTDYETLHKIFKYKTRS